MVFEDYHAGLNWIADGYKHKLFANDAQKSSEVLPQDDSFALLPSEKTETYAGVRIIPPSPLESHLIKARRNRPGTAPPRFAGAKPKADRPWSSKSHLSSGSKSSNDTRPSNQPRIRSAGSVIERHREAAKMRTTFTLVNKLYEDRNRRQNINLHPASPAPDYRYFDRHSRCFDYTHMHTILLHDQPQTACDLEPCSLHSRPVSSMSNYSRTSEEQIDTMKQPKRYINYHRPRTAPTTRSDANLQRRNNGARPRFCNIVKSVQLHSREGRDTSACTGDSGFDEFDFITRDGRLINRWRKDSGASSIPEHPEIKQEDLSKVTRSGLDGKPGTPTSVDEDLDRMDLNSTNKDDIDNDLIELVPPVVIVERLLDDEADRANTNKDKNNLTVPYDLDKYIKSDDIVASETPNQPPTTPEILTPKETVVAPPPPPPSKKKPCVTKKTLEKKPVNRPKKKEEMETPVDIPIKEPTLTPPPQVTEDKKEREIKVNLSEPALPEVKEPPPKQKKEKFKPEKFAIPTKPEKPKVEDDSLFDETLSNHLKKFELMVSDMTSPDESPRKHTNKPLKITGRLALSQQSSRFTLPMDMKELETMSPKEYLINYCKISKRRQNLYDNVYRQTVGAVTKPLPYKELEKALKNVLVDTLNNEYFKYICELLEIKEGEEVTCDLFSKIAALAERLLYPQYVTKETEDHKDYQKELIEVADFSALEWKFHGVKVRPEIQKLLKSLC